MTFETDDVEFLAREYERDGMKLAAARLRQKLLSGPAQQRALRAIAAARIGASRKRRVTSGSGVPRMRLSDARAKAAELLALLDELDLCQAAAHLSMAVDVLDRAAGEVLPTGSE